MNHAKRISAILFFCALAFLLSQLVGMNWQFGMAIALILLSVLALDYRDWIEEQQRKGKNNEEVCP